MVTQTQSTASSYKGDSEDALSLLVADHQKVGALFNEYENALDNDAPDQGDIAQRICRELEVHSLIEKQIFYPAVAEEDALKGLVDEALSEHTEVEATIARLKEMSPTDQAFGATMLQLIEDVERHVEEEEQVMFPRVEQSMSGQLRELGARLAERKRQLLSMQE